MCGCLRAFVSFSIAIVLLLLYFRESEQARFSFEKSDYIFGSFFNALQILRLPATLSDALL